MTQRERMARTLVTRPAAGLTVGARSSWSRCSDKINHARRFRQVLRRGVQRVQHERVPACPTHNVLNLRAGMALK